MSDWRNMSDEGSKKDTPHSSHNHTRKDHAISDTVGDDTRVDEATVLDIPTLWAHIEQELKNTLGHRVHKSWTGQLSLASYDEKSVLLATSSRFISGRIEARYGELVKTLWAKYDHRDVTFGVLSQNGTRPPTHTTKSSYTESTPASVSRPRNLAAPSVTTSTHFTPPQQAQTPTTDTKDRFSFENFIVGPSNEFAFAAARRVATSRECPYNPIVIHGPNGMGKTHLLHALQKAALDIDPTRRVKLISAENFVSSFVQSVRAQGRSEIDAFKANLRDVDVLIIDDAHFIADKPGSQEELLHTLISLVDDGKQILLATDRHPHTIKKASERLKSYLCGGLLCPIDAADFELRSRILDGLIERRRANGHPALHMPQNARDHLAARINATPRDLEGAFNQIIARLEFLGIELTLESVQEALAHSRYMGNTTPSVDKIQRVTTKEFGISMDEILSKRRSRAIARPRQVAMYLCKTLTKRSLPDIGRRFGGRDHTTVMHAIKRIEQLREQDKTLHAHIENIVDTLKSS
ncbi:MAG TPA: chromosomal replication initiator protein DnaA [Hellea balneolensis]|uniref:Chromosomal replication initiator protein DnaA n=1 Tax=Hellea balneolensis TaxID=287478 RepID=A0A7C3C228_9PROT|nr:chromosomal replication initiator protein DnaA [Hellea balneolensis]